MDLQNNGYIRGEKIKRYCVKNNKQSLGNCEITAKYITFVPSKFQEREESAKPLC